MRARRALNEGRLSTQLLAYLRRITNSPALEFAAPPEPLAGGADKHVLAFALRDAGEWDGPLVLKLFDEDDDAARVHLEASVQSAVGALSFPTPPVLAIGDTERIHGGHFFIMRRAAGTPLFDHMKRLSPRLFRVTPTLADLHLRLHALDPQQFFDELAARGIASEHARELLSFEQESAALDDRIRRGGFDQLADAMRWLRENTPAAPAHMAVCHGDFHLTNVIVDQGEVTGVIDWSITRVADPAYDIGRTAVLILCGRVDLPPPMRPIGSLLRRSLWARFLRIYRRSAQIEDYALRYFRAFHALRCLAMAIRSCTRRCGCSGLASLGERGHRRAAQSRIPRADGCTDPGDPERSLRRCPCTR